jgi:lipoprotein signal peptidase
MFRSKPATLIGLAMILFGGVHNLWERYTDKCVVDRIDFGLFYANGSDVMISIGLLIVIFASIIIKGGKK